jgi:hypothetical protein
MMGNLDQIRRKRIESSGSGEVESGINRRHSSVTGKKRTEILNGKKNHSRGVITWTGPGAFAERDLLERQSVEHPVSEVATGLGEGGQKRGTTVTLFRLNKLLFSEQLGVIALRWTKNGECTAEILRPLERLCERDPVRGSNLNQVSNCTAGVKLDSPALVKPMNKKASNFELADHLAHAADVIAIGVTNYRQVYLARPVALTDELDHGISVVLPACIDDDHRTTTAIGSIEAKANRVGILFFARL